MLNEYYKDRLDDMLLPAKDMMEFMPDETMQPVTEDSLLQETNHDVLGFASDKESPARIAKEMERASETFVMM